jgi:REP element-mobilizing transposase RayT
MANTLGYMLTWTTYGTWLQGDKRGYVKKGETLPGDEKLLEANKNVQLEDTFRLNYKQKKIVYDAIMNQAKAIGQKVLALLVYSNHIHLVAEYIPKPIGDVVAYYKKAGRLALKELGINGKIWTTGYDKRYCFDQISLERRIKYVQKHPA